jgi:two-component system, chemotaxis family, response regulator PixG
MIARENHGKNGVNFECLIAQLKDIERESFSGKLIVQVPSAQSWMLSFSSGHLSQVHGGIDSENRWERNLEIAYLNLPLDSSVNQDCRREVKDNNTVAQQSMILEVLFDIIQYTNSNNNQLSYQLIPISNHRSRVDNSLPLLKIRMLLAQALFNWQEWDNAGLSNYFPSKFVHVRLSELILSSPKNQDLQTTLLSIDGDRSLRDLAICHQKHILEFTKPLLPLIQENIIFFSDLADYGATEVENSSKKKEFSKSQAVSKVESKIANDTIENLSIKSRPLIACIDDELSVYKDLERILTQHRCRSFGIQQPYEIIPALIQNKPDLIFLDLIMPAINGYEICERIRKISLLKNVPVIILSSRDGSFEHKRAKLSGANGFLGKPIRSNSVMEILNKYIEVSSR